MKGYNSKRYRAPASAVGCADSDAHSCGGPGGRAGGVRTT